MRDWRIWTGMLLGAAIAAGILGWAGTRGRPHDEPLGPLLSECDGALRELVIQYTPSAAEMVTSTYREFLSQLPAGITVQVLCPDETAFMALAARVGPVACGLRPVSAGHILTCWARDRWLCFAPAGPGEKTVLWPPREEMAKENWPARAGDERVSEDLARAWPERVAARRSGLLFDGGDFMADLETVFVAPRVVLRNVQHTAASRADLTRELERVFRRRVVFLHDVPDHHLGMYMMVSGARTVLVGDPSLATGLWAGRGTTEPLCPCGDDLTPATQKLFDNCAAQCAEAGYKVIRIPTVPGTDGRTFITYVNVILDARDGGRTVYLPVYRRAEALNSAAEAVWRQAGYDVKRVDATGVYASGGCLHCLVNVLGRD